jgi:hypothetical protein
MDKADLEKRTKLFALDVIRFVNGLTQTAVGDTLGKQLLSSEQAVGTFHYFYWYL